MCRRGGVCIEVGTEQGLRFEHALRAAYQDIACGSAAAGVGPYGSVGAIWSIRSPRPYHPVGGAGMEQPADEVKRIMPLCGLISTVG